MRTLSSLLCSGLFALFVTACNGSTNTGDALADGAIADVTADNAAGDTATDSVPNADVPLADVPAADSGIYDPYNDPAQRSPATAITAPASTWTWVPFGDVVCANGSSSGLAVNLSPSTTDHRVLIYLEGGGACWDQATCYVAATAVNIASGYAASNFASDEPSIAQRALFNRADPSNPFRDANFVYVPYCTGDVYSGENLRTYVYQGMPRPTFFMGARNMNVFLTRLVPTFASADRVWLSGSSAGAFGAAFNFDRVQTAFGTTRVDLIDDSGPPMDTSRWSQWVPAWHIQFPSDCTTCANSPTDTLNYIVNKYAANTVTTSTSRFTLLSYDRDGTISNYFGLTADQFAGELTTLESTLSPLNRFKYFVLSGTNHTLLGGLDSLTAGDGTTLSTFLTQMATDDPAWANHHP